MFSFFINTNLAPVGQQKIHITEYLVWAWSLSLFLDEIRQVKASVFICVLFNPFDTAINEMFTSNIAGKQRCSNLNRTKD